MEYDASEPRHQQKNLKVPANLPIMEAAHLLLHLHLPCEAILLLLLPIPSSAYSVLDHINTCSTLSYLAVFLFPPQSIMQVETSNSESGQIPIAVRSQFKSSLRWIQDSTESGATESVRDQTAIFMQDFFNPSGSKLNPKTKLEFVRPQCRGLGDYSLPKSSERFGERFLPPNLNIFSLQDHQLTFLQLRKLQSTRMKFS
jgi:hypothetical protein